MSRWVSWALRKQMIACGRCGWQGRVALQTRAIRTRRQPVAAPAVPPQDLDLSTLDDALNVRSRAEKPSDVDLMSQIEH
jgi:hypothetical protein